LASQLVRTARTDLYNFNSKGRDGRARRRAGVSGNGCQRFCKPLVGSSILSPGTNKIRQPDARISPEMLVSENLANSAIGATPSYPPHPIFPGFHGPRCAMIHSSRVRLSGSVRMSPPKRIIVLAALALAFVAGAAVVVAVRPPTVVASASIPAVNSGTQ
jgi:hypothetical protein